MTAERRRDDVPADQRARERKPDPDGQERGLGDQDRNSTREIKDGDKNPDDLE